MKALERAIYSYRYDLRPMGASDDERRRKKLIADLEKILKKSDRLVWIIVAALLVLLLVSLWLVLFDGNLSSAKVAIGLLGISAGGSIKWLHTIWSQRSATEVLVRLATEVEGDALRKVIDVLGKKALG